MKDISKHNLDDKSITIDLAEEGEFGDESDIESEAEESLNFPIDGSPAYPHIYVGQSGLSDMVDYNEVGYKGDNYLVWHDIFPDIAASIYG